MSCYEHLYECEVSYRFMCFIYLSLFTYVELQWTMFDMRERSFSETPPLHRLSDAASALVKRMMMVERDRITLNGMCVIYD